MTGSDLPAPVAAYVAATNNFDIDAFMATFAQDALVNDHRDEFPGYAAIRQWAQREIIGDRVTMQVTSWARRADSVALTAHIDGNFKKTGLPVPLALTFYFSFSGEGIVQLIIVHNKPAT
jgi:ketosteroid isomerase-like protein